jgi:hypothetical protein
MESTVSPAQARTIAKEVYVYGSPMVDSYRILLAYFQNTKTPRGI